MCNSTKAPQPTASTNCQLSETLLGVPGSIELPLPAAVSVSPGKTSQSIESAKINHWLKPLSFEAIYNVAMDS